MLKNTLKTLFVLCSLSGIAHIAHGMEMEQEPKKLKLDQAQDLEEQSREQRWAGLIMKYVKENNLDRLRELFKGEGAPLVANKILNKVLVDGNNEDSQLIKCLPLTAAIKKLFDPARADKKDIDYAIATELINAGADLHVAESNNYAAMHPTWVSAPIKPMYRPWPIDFLARAVKKKERDVKLIDFLLENGSDPNQNATKTFSLPQSPLQIISWEIGLLEAHLNHGGHHNTPLKTPKIRKPIEKELDLLRTIEGKLKYYSEHFKEFNERRKEALEERIKLAIFHRQLHQIEIGRIQNQQLLRPECFEIDFLMSLGRK
jgi:hypothetical protein